MTGVTRAASGPGRAPASRRSSAPGCRRGRSSPALRARHARAPTRFASGTSRPGRAEAFPARDVPTTGRTSRSPSAAGGVQGRRRDRRRDDGARAVRTARLARGPGSVPARSPRSTPRSPCVDARRSWSCATCGITRSGHPLASRWHGRSRRALITREDVVELPDLVAGPPPRPNVGRSAESSSTPVGLAIEDVAAAARVYLQGRGARASAPRASRCGGTRSGDLPYSSRPAKRLNNTTARFSCAGSSVRTSSRSSSGRRAPLGLELVLDDAEPALEVRRRHLGVELDAPRAIAVPERLVA